MITHSSGLAELVTDTIFGVTDTIFDRNYYLRANPDVKALGRDPLEHFLKVGHREGRNPSPLFDIAYYRQQVIDRGADFDAVTHYATVGADKGLSPHPLFDTRYYQSLVQGNLGGLTPLAHFLQVGWKLGLSPHPLFDPEYYMMTSELVGNDINPLLHYLYRPRFNSTPHYLFSDAVYVAELTSRLGSGHKHSYRGGPPLAHYAQFGFLHRPKTHPLFDPQSYVASHARIAERAYRHPDPSLTKVRDLLRHYLEVGAHAGASPSEYFDPDYYRAQTRLGPDVDPIRHYLLPGNFSVASPHPGIDLDYYATQAGFARDDVPSVLHLLATPQTERVSPHPEFDVERYRAAYPDVTASNWCPILHFLAHGMAEDRSPNEWFSHNYVYTGDPTRDFGGESAVHSYFAARKHKRLRIVFVSHDAGLTGAPGTILRILEDISEYSNVECFAIVAGSGPRIPDFQRAAHTFLMHEPYYAASADKIGAVVRKLLEITDGNPPVCAIVNSAESRFMGIELARAGIPVITLVHEAADLYPSGAFDPMVETSQKLIFGSKFVLERARATAHLPDGKAIVRGQGLQQDYVGTMNKAAARAAILQEFKLPEGAFIVLGCGSIDYRKGADLFVSAAVEFLRAKPADRSACFVWVGEGGGANSIVSAFLANEVRANNAENDIRFIGPRTDVEPYFMAADTFLMTSRVDPFPCVAQEAMAAALPIVAFTEGGGTVEMIGEEAGMCVPLGDTKAMAQALLRLMNDQSLRRGLGQRGREIVRERWKPDDYSTFLIEQVGEVAGVDPEVFGVRNRRRNDGGRRVFFLLDEWRRDALSSQIEGWVAGLVGRGIQAEVILTRGRFAPSVQAGEPQMLPPVPYRFLQPGNMIFNERWRTTTEEIWRGIQRFCRYQQPCTLVVCRDDLAAPMGTVLPTSVGVVGLLRNSDPQVVSDIYQMAPSLDRIVSLSTEGTRKLIELNQSVSARLTTFSPWSSVSTDRGRRKKNTVYVRADLYDPLASNKLSAVTQALRKADPERKLIVHSNSFPVSDRTAAGVLASLGFADEELLVAPSSELLVATLERSDLAIFLGYDDLPDAIVRQALSSGAIVAALDPPDEVQALLADGQNAIAHRGHVSGLVQRVGEVLSNSKLRSKLQRGAAAWLVGGKFGKAEANEKLFKVLSDLFDELDDVGSKRLVRPQTAGFAALVWPERVRSAALSRISAVTYP